MGKQGKDFQSAKDEMFKFLSNTKGEIFDICAAVYQMILLSKEQERMFRCFLEEGPDIESIHSIEVKAYFTASKIQMLKRSCEHMVEGILNKLLLDNLCEEDFYNKLWDSVQYNPIFSTEEEKIYALYSIYSDPCIPYFQLEKGIKMTNEDFDEFTQSINGDIKKAVYILNAKLDQKTEVASLLMNLLNSYDSIEKQAVLLAHILFAKKNIDISEALIEKIMLRQ